MTQESRNQRVALVTGASSGIGEAVSLALARLGIRVAIAARRAERLHKLREELLAAGAPVVLVLPMDLRKEDQILAGFARVKETWGRLDILVNNAGLGYDASLVHGETEAWREMLEVNVLALCIATREAIALMKMTHAAGHIFHISSMSGHRIPEGGGVYSATKFAVRSLTEGLRQELRAAESPIRISSISPGFVQTEFAAKFQGSEEGAKATYSRYPVLQAEDIARTLLFALESPPHMEVHDILLRPTEQKS